VRDAAVPVVGLGWTEIAVLVLYLTGCLTMGFWFSKGQNSSEEYLLGSRSIRWWLGGVSYLVSLISTISLVAIPGEAFNYGIALAFRSLLEPVFALVTFYIFAGFYFRRAIFTPFTFLEDRFDRRVRLLGSLIFFLTRVLYVGLVLFSSARVFQGAAGWPPALTITLVGAVSLAYVMLGGLRAEIWNDFVQFLVLAGGVTLVAVLCMARVDGGIAGILSYASAHGRGLEPLANPEFYSFSPFVRISVWMILAGGFMEYLFYNSADQISVQRLLSTGNYRAAERSMWLVALLAPLVAAALWFLGLAVFAYYGQHPPGGAALTGDTALFRFVATELPPFVTGLFLAAMLAAIMSTVDSGLHSLATVIVKDYYVVFVNPQADEARQVRISRGIILSLGVLTIALALLMGRVSGNVQATFIEFAGIAMAFQGVLAPIFLIGVTSRRIVAADIVRAVAIAWVVMLATTTWYLYARNSTQPVSFLFVPFPGLAAMLLFGYLPALWRSRTQAS
jgi:SSS family solute:Na+ symporter